MQGYTEAFASCYDSLLCDVDYKERAKFFIEQTKRFKDRFRLVLDLACGTGSLSLELAENELEVIAVDISEEMLMQAREKAQGLSPEILFLCQDMEELDLYGTVEAAYCMLDSLNHLNGGDALQNAFDRLKFFIEPGGIFIFDMNTPFKHREVLADNVFVFDTPHVYCVWQNEYSEEDDCVYVDLDFFSASGNKYTRSSESFVEYSYEDEQIEQMLTNAEFELIEIQGDYTGQPPTEEEQRKVYIARRK